MSPEQAAGENLTAVSDLYSLGIVAHQCLAGSPPFKADTPLGVLSAHLRKPPPALPPDVPREVDAIVSKALQKDPSARWPNAAAFAQACREVRAMITTAPRQAPVTPSPTRVQSPPRPGPVHRTGPQVAAHTGSHPVPPPPEAPEAAPPAPEERPRSRKRLWATLAGALAVIGTAAAIAAAGLVNDDPSGPGRLPAGETDGDDAAVQGQDNEQAPAAEDDQAPGRPGETDMPDASANAEAEEHGQTSPPVGGLEPTENTTTAPGPTQSTSPTPQASVTVPDVVDQSEATARQRIEESDLAASVAYEGEGDHKCGVVRQYPNSGAKVQPDSTVQLTVQRAADAAACKNESEQNPSPTPRPGQ
ncbi:PASTA domain-containing protein, partial [Glycomyces tarimensis]